MEEIILADFYNENKDIINILVNSGVISNQIHMQKEVYTRFLELKEKYPSVLDRYEIVAQDFKISAATARKYIYKMKRRISIKNKFYNSSKLEKANN